MKLHQALVCVLAFIVVAQADITGGQVSNACQKCISATESLSTKVSSQYRDYVITRDHICSQIPAVGQPACEQLLEAANPVIRRALSQPAQACERLGACTKKEEIFMQLKTRSLGDDFTCPICEYVVVYLKEQLKDPETEGELIDQATQLCQLLPSQDLQAECLQDVNQYSQQIFAFIEQEDPEEICELATMCDASLSLPALPASLQETSRSIFNVTDDDQCNTCKLVIVQAAAALADPKTQAEILKYVKQQCGDFQAFQDQCEAYVELYGPLALNMARQYLSPDLCDQLGFCTPSVVKTLPFSA